MGSRVVLMLIVAASACSGGDSVSDELTVRSVEAVERFGRDGLTDDEIEEAAASLVDMCEQGRDSFGYRLGIEDTAEPGLIEALDYVCPGVFNP